jgi:hypothetical protein
LEPLFYTKNISSRKKYIIDVITYTVPLLASLLARDVWTTAEPYLNGCLSSTTSNFSEKMLLL